MRDPNTPTTWIRADVLGNGSTPYAGPYTLGNPEVSDVAYGGLLASPPATRTRPQRARSERDLGANV